MTFVMDKWQLKFDFNLVLCKKLSNCFYNDNTKINLVLFLEIQAANWRKNDLS